MPTPFTSAATLIRQSKDETGGKAYQIGDDLYIHAPTSPESLWRESIIMEQLSEIKFKEFSEKISKPTCETGRANARQVRKVIWDDIFRYITNIIPGVKIKNYSGKNIFYVFSYTDDLGEIVEFSIRVESLSLAHASKHGISIEATSHNSPILNEEIEWPINIGSKTMLEVIDILLAQILENKIRAVCIKLTC